MAEAENMSISSLKRLEFLRSYSTAYLCTAAQVAEKVYSSGRAFTPSIVEPYVATAEETLLSYSAPVVTAVQDASQKLLVNVDDKVDAVLCTSNQYVQDGKARVMETVKLTHDKNVKYYLQARDTYLKVVDQTVDTVMKRKEGLSNSVVQAADNLKHSVRKVSESGANNTAALLETLLQRFEQFTAMPAVASILTKASPVLEMAKNNYITAHDVLVGSPLYKQVYSTSFGLLDKASTTSLYQHMVYPVLAPVAEPAIGVLNKSQYYTSFTEYWKPVAV